MCLIVVGWQTHPDFPLVVAANRDEFYARPSAPAAPWPELPEIIGGRDLEAGGTWLGTTRSRRFAAVTNVREPSATQLSRSRGHLPLTYLQGNDSPMGYAMSLDRAEFPGFNLLVADLHNLYYSSNRGPFARHLGPGIYGLSNHLLDTPWPKLVKARERFAEALHNLPATDHLFQALADEELVPDEFLPKTGVPIEWERRLAPIFVKSETYGTCASTVLIWSKTGAIYLEERTFGPDGEPLKSSVISTKE